MGMGFAPTWLRQVSLPLLHKTTLTTAPGFTAEEGRKEREGGEERREREDEIMGNERSPICFFYNLTTQCSISNCAYCFATSTVNVTAVLR